MECILFQWLKFNAKYKDYRVQRIQGQYTRMDSLLNFASSFSEFLGFSRTAVSILSWSHDQVCVV